MITEVLKYLISFSIFVVLQAICINGIYECFKGSVLKDDVNNKIDYQGMVFYMLAPKFFEKYKYRTWSKPFFSCVRCMASVYGALTFWPIVIYLFGFAWVEILIFLFDVFVLVYLNKLVYNKG